MTDILRALYWEPWAALTSLGPWQTNLIAAVYLVTKLCCGGWMLARAGRSPLWVLLFLVPGMDVAMLWWFAYARWPFVDGAVPATGDARDA